VTHFDDVGACSAGETNPTHVSSSILSEQQVAVLRTTLADRIIAVCFGSGVDSTAMLVAMHEAQLRPHVLTFADTGGEKPETLHHLAAMNRVLAQWDWPQIDVCRKVPMASTGYEDLYGNCLENQTLPSLAFGMKSCSLKWKKIPQDQFLKGVKKGQNQRPPHPVWVDAQRRGERIIKLIGYDCGRADQRRSARLQTHDDEFDYAYPLQLIGWGRAECVDAITRALGANLVPVKSACYYCPASKRHELFWLAAHHPELLERALHLERVALTGKHSRFDQVDFGASWEDVVANADSFPSSKTTVGLGRSFAWNQWARVNDVVDSDFRVRRTPADMARFLSQAEALRTDDNALDSRR
jgi:hypothetical protein